MSPTPAESAGSLPGPLEQFEEELMETSDPEAVLERYRGRYPELSDTLRKLADAIAMLQATPLRQAGERRSTRGASFLPERFGPYKVVRSIGRGGMGEVYEALEEPLGRRVAIKTLRSHATTPNALQRFDRERRTLARLHHTNIVPIYATGSEGDLLYFAMPHLSGASLGQVIKTARSHELSDNGLASSSFEDLVREAHSRSQSASDQPAAPDASAKECASATVPPSVPRYLSKAYFRTAVQVMATVAEGLHHAHEAGVIHRDLKPGNIIVEQNGHAWVLDFGLAALKGQSADAPSAFAISAPASESDAILTAGLLGTPPYMAPEQHALGKQADVRSDVWGLGVTLYELLTLERAFRDGEAVVDSEPIPPRQLTPALDRGLEAIVLKAMCRGPDDRYPTAQALADDLNHWLHHEPVSVWPSHRLVRPPWRLWLWSKRNKGWAAAIVLVLLGCMSLLVFAEEQRQHAVEREQAKERQLELLDIQRIEQSDHVQGWARAMWSRIEGMKWKPEEKWAIQAQAGASLSGFDTRLDKEHPIFAQALAFAPDGRLWMSHTGEGPLRWNPETDLLEKWPLEVSGPLAIRPDGSPWQIGPTYIDPDRLDRSPHDARVHPSFPLQLLDVERQTIVRALPDPVDGGSRLLAWALSPLGSRAAATVLDPRGKQHLLVWDADSGNLLHRIATRLAPESPALPGPGLVFSPDASLLATWDGSGWVDLWSMTDGQKAASFPVQNAVHCVAFGKNHWYAEAPRTPVERWMIAVGGTDGRITLWNPASRGTWQMLRAPGADTLALAFSGDGTLLASAGRSSFVGHLWDVATGQHLVEFQTTYTTALAFSPDGTRLASSQWYPFETTPALRPATRIFALDEGRGIRQLRGLPGSVMKVVFSRDGKRVAALSEDWWAGIWDRDSGRLVRLCSMPRGQVTGNADLAFSPDARSLAVSAGNTATLWNVESGEARRWPLPWGLADAIAFPDAEHLILMRAEVRDGSRPPDSQAPPSTYPRVCVIRNLLGRDPKTPVNTITDLNWGVQEIKASPDGTHFLVDGRSGVSRPNLKRHVRAYRSDGTLAAEISPKIPLEEAHGRFTFDPTGRLLIHYQKLQPIQFELPSFRLLGPTPISQVTGVAQEARLWTGQAPEGDDVRLYDRDGKILLDRIPGTFYTMPLFSPDLDGRYMIWGDRSRTVCLVDLVEIRRRLTGVGLGW